MPDFPHLSPVTIEDLLRLKRAERTSPEFWTRFESELRQKQLAALIERRPWWQTFPQVFAKPRMFMPVGATAILVLTLVSVKFYSPDQVARVLPLRSGQVSPPAQLASTLVSLPSVDQVMATNTLTSVIDSDPYQGVVVDATVPLSDHLPEHAAELTPWSASLPVQSPTARLFATNPSQTERIESQLAQSLTNRSVPAAYNRTQRSGGAVAELASVSALSSKRSRLLAQFNGRQFSPEPQAPAIVRERLTRHLAETDTNYSEHFTRVGLKGDQVSLRF